MTASNRASALLVGVLLAAGLGCSSSRPAPAEPRTTALAGVTRLRLPLSNSTVDPGAALRCYADCQAWDAADGYLECLSECPGFETTPGVACAPNEVPPLAACFTARPAPLGSEPQAISSVVVVIGDVPVIIGVAAVCASQTEPCSPAGAGLVP